jgi:uncharacterized phage protein (TIGR01671 family)
MKRVIKFRGKRIGKEWVYGLLYYNSGHFFQIVEHQDVSPTMQDLCGDSINIWHDVDPETVGQFTGLLDKNGTEIYEGDIVKNSNRALITLPTDDRLYLVEWQEGKYTEADSGAEWLSHKPGFVFRKLHTGMQLIFSTEQIEVIGNIYSNPELLQP